MVSSIGSGMSMPPPPPSSSSSTQNLTEDQMTLISDTLSELDVDNLTEQDALSIVEAFSEAGIEPGRAMESAMSDLGFDAKEIGDLAGIEGREGGGPPPPPPESQSSEEISNMVSFLEELLEEKLADSSETELNDQDKEAIYAKVMEQFGIEEGESIINTTA